MMKLTIALVQSLRKTQPRIARPAHDNLGRPVDPAGVSDVWR